MFNLYSILLSFLLHSLLYAFSDIGFISAIFVIGSTFKLFTWLNTLEMDFVSAEMTIFDSIVTDDELERYWGFTDFNGKTLLSYIRFAAVLHFMRWVIDDLELRETLALLRLIHKCGWKDPDNPIYWLSEAITETEVQSLYNRTQLLIKLGRLVLNLGYR